MPELHLQCSGSTLDVILGAHRSSFPSADVALNATTWEDIYDDAVAYGRDLFDKTFRDEQVRTILSNLPANERLLLVAQDPLIAAIPWEYLRDQNNKLLASRLNFVRGIPEAQRKDSFAFNDSLEIVAVPVSPVDEQRKLNVEGEWKNLIEAVAITNPPKSLALKRVRPPTRNQLERSLGRQCTSIVHFMGHSTSHDGRAFLAFEDARARSHLVDAADFVDSLNSQVSLVVLNSCLSAVVAPTQFGNIARALVHRGVPYALGMQFILPDDAALAMSDALYDFLLQEHSVEEAVMHARRALEEPGKLSNPHWLAGIPVLYTNLRTPAPPIELAPGQPTIQPDPQRLEKTCDLTGLPRTTHFVGRSKEISEVLDAMLAHRPADFVVLHGLGGIGKTSLARVVAERVSYHYGDRIFAVSFETFTSLDAQGQAVVDEYFADRFYNQLAHFYGLDPAAYTKTADLQRAILQRRILIRSLLILDNIETLIDAQRRGHPAAKALAAFISRLKEGDGIILLTTRIVPPSDWGDCRIVSISGLDDDAGGSLLLALLPPNRRVAALPDMHRKLSQRVKGHPLSIRLLAGRFAEATTDLEAFMKGVDAELQAAEQATPTSLEDSERHATLYACMDYSVKRLAPDQRKVLDAVSLFQAPFLPEFAAHLLNDEEQTPVHLQNLVLLGLLNMEVRTFKEGELVLLELHPMLRWYIQHHLSELDAEFLERYGQMFELLSRLSYQLEGGYDQSSLMRYLVRQSLPDLEAALHYLPPTNRAALADHLAKPYQRLGQNRRALALYEQALELYQELGTVEGVAVTQSAMANVLSHQGKPQDALLLYEQSLCTTQQLGDLRGVAVTQSAMANVLSEQGKPQEAMALYEQSLDTMQQLGDIREVAVTQSAMADMLSQLGKPQEAMALYEQSLHTMQELGDLREVAVTQHAIARELSQLGKLPEALALYEQSLHTMQQLGDLREVAVTQRSIARELSQQGKLPEALALYEQSLHTMQELGDLRGVAVTQHAIADVLSQQGKLPEAITLYEQALHTMQELGDLREVAMTQHAIAGVLSQRGKLPEALALYEQSLHTKQELGDIQQVAVTQHAMANVLRQLGKLPEAMALYERILPTAQELGDIRGVAMTQHAMADLLSQQGKPQDALALYEQALRTKQQLGDIRGVAMTQHAIASVLSQQGELQDALFLYEQALHTKQELGDIRQVAVTQHAMANVLRQQGKLPEAIDLYEQSLHTMQQLGDRRDVAIMQSAMADVLSQQGKPQDALTLYEQALRTAQELGDLQGVAVTQSAMADVLSQQGKLPEALALYEQSLHTKQQLGDIRGAALGQANLSLLLVQQGEQHRALPLIWEAYTGLSQHGFTYEAQVMQESLIFIKDQVLGPEQFDTLWEQVISERQPRWLLNVQANPSDEQSHISPEQLEGIVFNTVAVMTAMPEKRDEWREMMTSNLRQAQTANLSQEAQFFTAILALLDGQTPSLPERHPYADALGAIQAGIAAGGLRNGALPFDPELVPRSIAALLGSSHQKLAHAQYLTAQATKTTDEGTQALIHTIQLALFEKDLSQLGRNLDGIYRQAWETIAAGVEAGGVDPRMFDLIINRTLAVLGSASNRRSEWRNNLVEMRNQATAERDRNMVALLDAVIGLLDASGNPKGLGEGLKGIYAETWQAIVKGLSK